MLQLTLLAVGLLLTVNSVTAQTPTLPVGYNASSVEGEGDACPSTSARQNVTYHILQDVIAILQNEVVPLLQDGGPGGTFTDCKDAYDQGSTTSGEYTLQPDDGLSFSAYCDMDTDGGGWTVFQRRQDGSVDFARDWLNYELGFGDPTGEYWLGLERLNRITALGASELRIDMIDGSDSVLYAEYSSFDVGDSTTKYTKTLSGYSGTAGDGLTVADHHNNARFSTYDQDNDNYADNCATVFGGNGGWWYNQCFYSNLNGQYDLTNYMGVYWNGNNMKFTEMKVRRL